MFSTDEMLKELRNGASVDDLGNKLAEMLTNNLNEAREKYEAEQAAAKAEAEANEKKSKIRDAGWDVIDSIADLYEVMGYDTTPFEELTDEDIDYIITEITCLNKLAEAFKTPNPAASAKKETRSDNDILQDFLNALFNT